MSDNDNNGSIVDAVIIYTIIGYLFIALIVLFPLAPGGIMAYEISMKLTSNSDINKLSIILGMIINFFIYASFLKSYGFNFSEFKTKIYLYIFTSIFLVFINTIFENKLLQTFNDNLFSSIAFLLDFNRWFVDNGFINLGLIALYTGAIFYSVAFISQMINFIRREKRASILKKNVHEKTQINEDEFYTNEDNVVKVVKQEKKEVNLINDVSEDMPKTQEEPKISEDDFYTKIKNDYIYIDSNILMHDKFPELLFTCRHASYLDSARIMTWTSHA
jgi:hypothetical protein